MDNYDSHVQGGIDSKIIDIITAKAQRHMLRELSERKYKEIGTRDIFIKEEIDKLDVIIGEGK